MKKKIIDYKIKENSKHEFCYICNLSFFKKNLKDCYCDDCKIKYKFK